MAQQSTVVVRFHVGGFLVELPVAPGAPDFLPVSEQGIVEFTMRFTRHNPSGFLVLFQKYRKNLLDGEVGKVLDGPPVFALEVVLDGVESFLVEFPVADLLSL
jgi:hypothetical protein